MNSDSRGQPVPICPRCGYDQSGVAATWEDRCPLVGLCSECGVEFPWALLLSERVAGPGWSIEHGPRMRAWRVVRALLASVRPGLWRRFQLALHVNTGRLWAFMAISLMLHHVLLVLLAGLSDAATMWVQVGAVLNPFGVLDVLFPYASEMEIPLGGWGTVPVSLWPLSLLAALSFIVPALLMLVFAETMSRVGVRRVQLLRGAAYMLPGVALGVLFGATVAIGIIYLEWLGDPLIDTLLQWIALAAIVFWPIVQVLRWRSFIRQYLRLPHSNWIALSMLIVLLLTIVTTFVVIANMTNGF